MLFRAGSVNPCDLSHWGIAPRNGLCVAAQGKKMLVCISGHRSTVHLVLGLSARFSLGTTS